MSRRFKSYKQAHKDNINNYDSEKIESVEIFTEKEITEFKTVSPSSIKNKTSKPLRNHRMKTEDLQKENQIKVNLNRNNNKNVNVNSNEKVILVQKNSNNFNRPLLTQDEINQIKNDFNLLDITKSGSIKPNLILVFMEKNKNFQKLNPFYFSALKNLNSEENNKNGIKVDQFIKEIKKVIREKVEDDKENFEKNWQEYYNLFFNENEKNKVLNKEKLEEILNKVGYKLNEDEINLIIEEYGEINQNKFVEIMKNVELKNRK